MTRRMLLIVVAIGVVTAGLGAPQGASRRVLSESLRDWCAPIVKYQT
jgi:hypothetical protein